MAGGAVAQTLWRSGVRLLNSKSAHFLASRPLRTRNAPEIHQGVLRYCRAACLRWRSASVRIGSFKYTSPFLIFRLKPQAGFVQIQAL